MNRIVVLAVTLASIALVGGAAYANPDLARAKNCMACHTANSLLLGPSYRSIAAKYADDKDAAARLAKRIREGGVGAWGQMAMPPQPQVSEAEALALAEWVLATK
jgi:cytochrome c